MSKIVYGAGCTWWDSIEKSGRTDPSVGGHRLPCCPHCGSVLFEVPSEEAWYENVDRYEADGHPDYRAMMEWARGKCFPSMAGVKTAYAAREVE